MTKHRWKYVMDTENSTIYVDYNTKTTKIVGTRYIYYYGGIYPNIDYNTRKRFKK
jgi:hypothetical protein